MILALINLSVGEHAWLHADLSVLPYKEDFGSGDKGRGRAPARTGPLETNGRQRVSNAQTKLHAKQGNQCLTSCYGFGGQDTRGSVAG